MVRLRQAVLAARDLEPAVARLRAELALGEPYTDPGVAHFGLRNAVFAIGDTFLEVVSPAEEGTAAGRLLDRRGGDCGYMAMFQVDDLTATRQRARAAGVREVFEVELEDMAEVHLHPSDMRGAIVSASRPEPPDSWRWGGEGWAERSAPCGVAGMTVAVADAVAASERWTKVLGALPPGVEFVADPAEAGIVEILIEREGTTVSVTP